MKAFIYRYAFVAILCGSLLSSTCILHGQQSGQERQGDAAPDSSHPGPPHGSPPSPERELAHLTRVLTLTEAQKAPILTVLEERHTKVEALMQSGADRAAIGQQMRAITTSTNTEIRALPTEPQQKIFDTMRPPHPPTRSASGDGPPPDDAQVPPPPQ